MSLPALARRLNFEALRTISAAGVTADYNPVGYADPTTSPALQHPARGWLLQNLTDADLLFSIDGATDHFVLPNNSFWIEDITTNKTKDDGFYLAQGTTLYVKRLGTPTTGSVYFAVIYGSD